MSGYDLLRLGSDGRTHRFYEVLTPRKNVLCMLTARSITGWAYEQKRNQPDDPVVIARVPTRTASMILIAVVSVAAPVFYQSGGVVSG